MEWPAFEERLRELGYGPRAIAHAFSTLRAPGTVDEALEELNRMPRHETPPIALSFETTETRGGPSEADGVTIPSVERDDLGIRVSYDSVSPLDFGSEGPRGEAKDDLGNHYENPGSHFGRARDGWHGGVTLPPPPPAAGTPLILIASGASRSSIWVGLAHEVLVTLPG